MSADEYDKRVNLCVGAIVAVCKKLQLPCHTASDYQGMEIVLNIQPTIAEVIILMSTGLGPRFPKHVTLTVHGYVEHKVNKKVFIVGGGIASTERKFLPNQISKKWLEEAILNTAESVVKICATENMDSLIKEALKQRHHELRESASNRFKITTLRIKPQ